MANDEDTPKKKRRTPRGPNKKPFPTTPEQIQRLRPHQFQEGESGNPDGYNRAARELTELFAQESPAALSRIIDMSIYARQESTRLKANQYILNKVVSDAVQRHEHDVKVTSTAELIQRAAEVRAQRLLAQAPSPTVIDAEIIVAKEKAE